MRGHITKQTRKDKDGNITWQSPNYAVVIELDPDPVTGKRRQQWVSVKGNKKDADKRLAELLHQLDIGSFVKPGKGTVKEHLDNWLHDYCQANLSPRTYELYSYILHNHIVPTLGNVLLTQLKPQHLQRLYSDKLAVGLSNRTVQIIHNTLHRALSNAVKMGILARNPVDAVDSPKIQRREMHVMSESDLHLFLEQASGGDYHTLFYLLLFTGMRRSEALALRWSDVDLLLCQISINRTLHYLRLAKPGERLVFKSPKTEKGRRMIALSPSLVSILKEHRAEQDNIRLRLGLPLFTNDDLVFCHYDGTPLLPDSISHAWVKLIKRCGLKGIRLHDARHTHASLMLKQGIHPKIVQERLGHASIAITLDTYSHVAPGLQQAAANKFDEVLSVSNPLVKEGIRR